MKENFSENINELKKELEEFLQTRFDLTRLHIAGELSRFISGFLTRTVVLYFLFLALMFFAVAGALLLGQWINSYIIGFASMGLIFLLATLAFWLLRKIFIERPIVRNFIELMFPKFDDDEETEEKE
ncbi:MAG: phage holin family protein [Bacteroidota bacterium]